MEYVIIPAVLGVDRLWTGDDSMVVKDLRSRGRKVQTGAKIQVGRSSGRLARSIDIGPTEYVGGSPQITIGSDLTYALLVHQGTRRHVIKPRNSRSVLKFPGRGGFVYARVVIHPGTRPNRYLLDNLRRAV